MRRLLSVANFHQRQQFWGDYSQYNASWGAKHIYATSYTRDAMISIAARSQGFSILEKFVVLLSATHCSKPLPKRKKKKKGHGRGHQSHVLLYRLDGIPSRGISLHRAGIIAGHKTVGG